MKLVLFFMILGFASMGVWAGEKNGVKMPDSITVDGKTLVLNGMGLRKVTKMGFQISVYVGGLYVEKKTDNSETLIKNDETKRLVMHYLLPVSRDQLLEGFQTSFENGCYVGCDKKAEQMKFFKDNVVGVSRNDEITLTFYKDKLEINTTGSHPKKETLSNADLSHNAMSMYINAKSPPTEEFRKGLLGAAPNGVAR